MLSLLNNMKKGEKTWENKTVGTLNGKIISKYVHCWLNYKEDCRSIATATAGTATRDEIDRQSFFFSFYSFFFLSSNIVKSQRCQCWHRQCRRTSSILLVHNRQLFDHLLFAMFEAFFCFAKSFFDEHNIVIERFFPLFDFGSVFLRDFSFLFIFRHSFFFGKIFFRSLYLVSVYSVRVYISIGKHCWRFSNVVFRNST